MEMETAGCSSGAALDGWAPVKVQAGSREPCSCPPARAPSSQGSTGHGLTLRAPGPSERRRSRKDPWKARMQQRKKGSNGRSRTCTCTCYLPALPVHACKYFVLCLVLGISSQRQSLCAKYMWEQPAALFASVITSCVVFFPFP